MNKFASHTEEKNWAMFCHLSALAGFIIPFGNIIGPFILWSIKKDYSELVNREGIKSMNFQISITIYVFVSAALIFIGIGILLVIALALLDLIFVILAVVKTLNDEDYKYPLSINFIK